MGAFITQAKLGTLEKQDGVEGWRPQLGLTGHHLIREPPNSGDLAVGWACHPQAVLNQWRGRISFGDSALDQPGSPAAFGESAALSGLQFSDSLNRYPLSLLEGQELGARNGSGGRRRSSTAWSIPQRSAQHSVLYLASARLDALLGLRPKLCPSLRPSSLVLYLPPHTPRFVMGHAENCLRLVTQTPQVPLAR